MLRTALAFFLAALTAACTPPAEVGVVPPAVENLAGRQTPAAGLVVTNARIIDGTGNTIETGSVFMRDGRVVSVASGVPDEPGALVIDAEGRTVLPGFI